jgi:hypothetical protein
MTPDLAEFLLARIDDDELNARNAAEGGSGEWVSVFDGGPVQLTDQRTDEIICQVQRDECAWHMGWWNPARVLTDCEAKRRIVQLAQKAAFDHDLVLQRPPTNPVDRAGLLGKGDGKARALLWALRLMAMPYVHHPDYRDEWQSDESDGKA